MKLLIILTFLSINSWAHENGTCKLEGSHDDIAAPFQDLLNEVQLMHNAANEKQFANSPCKTTEAPDVNVFLGTLQEDLDSKRVEGFRLVDQPEILINAFKDLAKNYRPVGQQSQCSTVLCAVDSIWGPEVGRKLLYMKIKHGYNGSEYANSRSDRFTSRELDKVLITLGDLPPHMQRIGRNGNQRLVPAPPGVVHPGNPLAVGDAAITLYQGWRSNSDYIQQYTLFHEYAHNLGDLNRDIDRTAEWRELATCQVSNYGNTNQVEDFAESVMAYRYNGQGLKENCPDKFDLIKNRVFNGIEYTDYRSCGP